MNTFIKKFLYLTIFILGIYIFSTLSFAADTPGGPLPFYDPNHYDLGYQNDIPGYNSGVPAAQSSGGGGGSPKTFKDLIMNIIIGNIITPLATLIVASAVVVFLYGVLKFIRSEGKEKEAGKQFMVWGIVGIFVMVSVWGLVNILQGTFNLDNSQIEISRVIIN